MCFNPENRPFWEDSIIARRSLRSSYDRRAVETRTMEQLQAFTRQMPLPFDHSIEIRYFKSRAGKALANNLKNPPEDCVAFIAGTDLTTLAKVGFLGELLLLYATGLGLSTCWFGHYMLDEAERLLSDVERVAGKRPKMGYGAEEVPGRRIICLSPLGYMDAGRLKLLDRMTGKMYSGKRKPLAEFLPDPAAEAQLAPELRYALNLARMAPSAANKQHWQFTVSPDQKQVTIAKPRDYKHPFWEHPDVCVGCCAAHFWLGLMIQGIGSAVTPTVESDRVVWNFALGGKVNDA